MDFRKNKLYKGAEKNLDFFLEDRVFNSSFFYKRCKKFCKIKLKNRGKICYNKNEEIPNNFNTLREIHKKIGMNLIINCGNLRTTPVSIGGTDWKPNFPIESQIKEELDEFLEIQNPTERAITIMLWAMRRQMFLDGNKRTAMLFANKIMIENGCGIIQISVKKQAEFFEKLLVFYEKNDMTELKQWIYENAIEGMEF